MLKRAHASRTRRIASSKSPRIARHVAPYASVCASLPLEIFPAGTNTIALSPACAAYAASDELVLPVDAHATAVAFSRTACVTATVLPRSLNEPVGFSPSCLKKIPFRSYNRVPPSVWAIALSTLGAPSRERHTQL